MSKTTAARKEAPGPAGPLQVTYRPLAELIPFARNSRTHSDAQIAQIAASIREFSFTNPVLTDEQGGIIAGHGRVLAARQLGLAEVPCIELRGLSEVQKRAYVIADNKLALNAGWDEELLAVELQGLADEGYDALLTGFDQGELDELLKEHAAPEPDVVEDEPPDLPKNPVTKLGDVWTLGDSVLVCGDARQALRRFSDGVARLLVTDPPYGVSYGAKNARLNAYDGGARIETDIENDGLDVPAMQALWLETFTECARVLMPGGAYYVTGPGGAELSLSMMLALRDSGLGLRHGLVWVKNSHALGAGDYHYKHEPIFYGWTSGAPHLRVADRSQMSTWEIDRPKRADLHPTMKPVELYARAMRNSSNQGDIILEPFAGSGTAYVAAAQLERRVYGVELSPAYCDVIVQRWEQLTGGKATRA